MTTTTSNRNFRIENDLWERGAAAAAVQGTTVSAVLREALEAFATACETSHANAAEMIGWIVEEHNVTPAAAWLAIQTAADAFGIRLADVDNLDNLDKAAIQNYCRGYLTTK